MHTPRIAEAIAFAEQAHRGQLRKGTSIPYLAHLIGVCSIVLEHDGDEDQAVGAVLHDVVEDTPVTVPEVRGRFGDRVAAIVDACTDTPDVEGYVKTGGADEWLDRKRAYVAHLADTPPDSVLVSAADKFHNASAILRDVRRDGAATLGRFTGRRDGTLWYYGRLRAALGARLRDLPTPRQAQLADELDEVVTALAAAVGLDTIPDDVDAGALA